MIGTHAATTLVFLALTAPLLSAADNGGLFSRKPRLDTARVRQLTEILRSSPDEKKRKAAVAELAEADPLVHLDVIPALVTALRKDVAAVRAAAAETIGRFKTIFPHAGSTLESVADSDPSQAVRAAARQTLWEYHLNGYRSMKGTDALAAQTIEPPIARPARPRLPVTSEPPPAVVVTTTARLPVVSALVTPPDPLGPPPGPRADLLPRFFGLRAPVTGSTHPNLTVEPPIARQPVVWLPPPTPSTEPHILPRYPDPVVLGKVPQLVLDLPPIVTPP